MPTLQELQDERAKLIAARDRILESQEYRISGGDGGGRQNRRADLQVVLDAIKDVDLRIDALQTAGTRRVYYIR